jgi:hypothetical protein
LPHFDGTNFTKWKHLMRAYLIGLHLVFGRLCAVDFNQWRIPKSQQIKS